MADEDDRVDALAAALGDARWRVDDLTRARIEARLRAAIPRIDTEGADAVKPVELADPRARTSPRRRWPAIAAIVLAAAAASAAAATLAWQLQQPTPSGIRTASPGDADRAGGDHGTAADLRPEEWIIAPPPDDPTLPREDRIASPPPDDRAPEHRSSDHPAPTPVAPADHGDIDADADRKHVDEGAAETAAAVDDADALYRQAERAMADHDRALAARTLRELTRRFPSSALAAQAHYELARFAFADAALDDARAALERAADSDRDRALAEPIAYLRCRVDVAAGATAAPACLTAFRAAFPRSSHDAEVLALLAAAHYDAGDCTAAAPLLDEYVRRHPHGPFAAGAADRLARCDADPD